jgi:hypothetical protein
MLPRSAATLLMIVAASTACHPPIRSTLSHPPTPAQTAELWFEPQTQRDLFWGVGGEALAPDPSITFHVLSVRRRGEDNHFSDAFTVEGPDHRKWSAKLPPEASTEVVASRILWGVGYHQPPIYYVGRWNADKSPDPNPQLPARFRESKPEFHGLEAKHTWSYYQNPFVGTREMNGLLVLQVMLCNSDLKDDQNEVYTLKQPVEGAKRWYVARDLGQSFGSTGVIDAPRGDILAFEQTPFIKGVANGKVQFEWHGRHGVLLEQITPADVHWMCERLRRLTDRQWQDAFRAGGYAPQMSDRFIRRFKQKIEEGLAVR